MRKIRLSSIILSALMIVTLVDCQHKDHKDGQEQAGQEHHEHHQSEPVLKMNHGEKWPVNEATEVGMDQLEIIINDFTKEGGTDFVDLANQLKAETDIIIQKCDMKGEAHEQLHLVLHPILDQVHKLNDVPNAQEGALVTDELSELLQVYHTHFQYTEQ